MHQSIPAAPSPPSPRATAGHLPALSVPGVGHYSTVLSMKNVAVLTEDGTFALFFRPHPGGFDSSRVPTPGNLPFKAKKMLMPGGQPGGVLGAGGID